MSTAVLKCCLQGKRAINSIGESPQEPDGTIKGEETDGRITKVSPSIMDIVGITGFGSSVATMILTEGHVVTTACLSTMVLAPYAALQKRELKGLGGMRGQQNELRASVNTMSQENNILHGSITKMETQIDMLEQVERDLEAVAISAQTNVNRLVDIVKENGILQAQIKEKLEKQVIQNVMSVVVQVDVNRDFSLGPQELEMLVLRLKNMPGIKFDEPNFRKACGRASADGTTTLAEIMQILRNLKDDTVAEEDNIFHLQPKELLK